MTQRRRAKGDGGLYQRHNAKTCPPADPDTKTRPDHRCEGSWVGTIELDDGKRLTVYGRTKKAAQLKLEKAKQEKAAGILSVANTTVEGWLTYWIDKIAARDLKPQALRTRRTQVEQYLIPQLGRHRLRELRPDHIRRLHDWMAEDRNLSNASIRGAHFTLKKALRDAMYDGLIPHNPADRVKTPSLKATKIPRLTLPESRKVLKAAGADARWWLALFYGMRQGEVLGLRWADVDFDAKVLRVTETLQATEDGELFLGDPKTEQSARTLPLMPQIEVRLRLLYTEQGDPAPDALVFPGAGGEFRKPRDDRDDWHALLDQADVPHVQLRSARNSAASLLEAAGVPDRLVAQILGHSQVSMTHHYQQADLERERLALAAGGDLLELD